MGIILLENIISHFCFNITKILESKKVQIVQKKESIINDSGNQKYNIVIPWIILIYILNSCRVGTIKYYLGVQNETFT